MRIRLEHKKSPDGRYHIFTSPDVKGFCVADESLDIAKREALAVLTLIRSRVGAPDEVPVAVEFENLRAA